jgi:hypothetical protein
VRDNLRNFNVRADLKKWSEVGDAKLAQKEDLPRYFLSTDHELFEKLMKLLDGSEKETAADVWDLVQMLATNDTYYRQVLKLEIQKDKDKVDWAAFFDKSMAYNLLYRLQIVQAVIAENDQADTQRAWCTNPLAFHTAKLLRFHYPTSPPDEVAENEEESKPEMTKSISTISKEEEKELRGLWAREFVTNGGFAYILNDFMTADLAQADTTAENIDLKYIAFKLQVMRTFIMAAIANTDLDAYAVS